MTCDIYFVANTQRSTKNILKLNVSHVRGLILGLFGFLLTSSLHCAYTNHIPEPRTMVKEVTNNLDRQAKIVYDAVPIDDQDDGVKSSMNDQGTSYVRKMHWFTMMMLLGMLLFFVHKIMFYHHIANVFHFAKHGPPCHHHVRFTPTPSDENHVITLPHSMVPPPPFDHHASQEGVPHGHHMNMGVHDMHHPPHHGGFHKHDKHHHHMNPHNMDPPAMHHLDVHYGAVNPGDVRKPSPFNILTPEGLSTWKDTEYEDSSDDNMDSSSSDSKDSSSSNSKDFSSSDSMDSSSSDSSKSADESSDLDMWERIADYWVGSKDSSDSIDESSDLDFWERIADSWVGSKDHSKDSSDSSDDSEDEDEDVWEQIEHMWEKYWQHDISLADKNK